MPEVNRRWVYPTVTATQNKGIERIALSGEGTAHELVGIDGSRRFGCRPVSGFRLARELDILKNFSDGSTRPYSAQAPPAQTKRSTVTDCFPVHFQIKEGEFGYGFVYRVSNTTSKAAIYMDYCPSIAIDDTHESSPAANATSGWRTILISEHPIAGDFISPTAPMDVVSMGKYVITFVQGEKPRVFYMDFFDNDNNAGTAEVLTHTVVNGGPGARSTEFNYPNASEANFSRTTDDPLSLPLVFQLFSTTDNPSSLGSGYSADYKARNFKKLDFGENGDYSFAFYLNNSQTGRRSPLSEIIQYRKGDERTNIVASYAGITFEADTSKYDQIYLFRSAKLQSVGGTYSGSILHLDGITNFSDLGDDAAGVTNDVATDYTEANIKKFTVHYELDDIALVMQDTHLERVLMDEEMPRGSTAVGFENSLLVADPTNEATVVTRDISDRVRNIGEIRWSSLTEKSPELFPINNKYVPEVFQNKVMRLVKTGEFAVGFSSDRLYHIRRSGTFIKIEDLHAGFGLTGRDACAAVGPLCYYISNKGMKAVANNGQLDDIQSLDNLLLEDWYDDLTSIRMAFDPYSACLFVLNPNKDQTVCMWFATGRVTEIHDTPFSDVKSGIWPRSWTTASPTISSTTSMVERSFFLQNATTKPSSDGTEIPSTWKPRVYVLDYDRSKTYAPGVGLSITSAPSLRTLDVNGLPTFTVHNVSTSSTITTLVLRTSVTGGYLGAGVNANELVGAYAYIVDSKDKDKIGRKAKITDAVVGLATADQSDKSIKVLTPDSSLETGFTFLTGDVVAISPVFFRYVGGALPMVRTEDGQVSTSMDLFKNKQISSIGAHFTDVSGGHTDLKFYKAQVYNTESDLPAITAFPKDFSGTIKKDSIKNGESEDYAAFGGTTANTKGRHGIQDSSLNPSIEIFANDLDFKLMALICRGRSTNTDTGDRNTS